MRRCALTLGALVLLSPPPATAQGDGPELKAGGLFRSGVRVERAELGRRDGFELFDVRGSLAGRVGIVFDYFLQAEFDQERDRVRLLDGYLEVAIRPEELLALRVGQFKAPFGREQLLSKGEILFVERAQASTALTPARQVGVQLGGRAAEGRLFYAAGVFNGAGRTLENDNDAFLYAARVALNSIGEIAFYDDLVFEVGVNVAFSRDTALEVLPVVTPRAESTAPLERDEGIPGLAPFTGDRFLWGLDARVSYRDWSLGAEYLRGAFDVDRDADPVPLSGGGAVLPGEELTAEGVYVELSRRFLAAFEGVLRYDALRVADGAAGEARRTRFLLFGLNVYPGFHTKVGFQYAAGLDGSGVGTGVADGQFLTNLQISF